MLERRWECSGVEYKARNGNGVAARVGLMVQLVEALAEAK